MRPHAERPVVVVSSDTHVGPLLKEQLRDYCPREYLEAFDDFVSAKPDQAAVMKAMGFSEENMQALMATAVPAFAWNAQTAGHYDVHARLADMDRDGVAAGVIFHGSQNGQQIPFLDTTGPLRGGEPPSGTQQEMDRQGRRIYNRWLADFCSVQPERHIGLCQVPMWDIEASIDEVIWAHEHGLRGVNFPAPSAAQPSYEDPSWEPFFAVCAERNMVLNTHTGGADNLKPVCTGPASLSVQLQMEGTWLSRRAMWLLTFTGVFDRHPALKLAITELPGAWWAETVREMDSVYFNPHNGPLRDALQRKPSEYVSSNMFMGASFQSREEAVVAVENGAQGQVMWGSDYPHIEGTWRFPERDDETPVTLLSLANTFHGLPEQDVRMMAGENAIACFGLDGDALERVAERIGPSFEQLAQPPDLSLVPEGYHGSGFRTHGAWS